MHDDVFRALDDSALADVLIAQQRIDSLAKTVQEQQRTIEVLQEENRSARMVELGDVRELRRQLAESEQMRALTSDELQRARAVIDQMKALAAGAIREEYRALAELSDLGYLNVTGYNRMDELQQWLLKYENQ